MSIRAAPVWLAVAVLALAGAAGRASAAVQAVRVSFVTPIVSPGGTVDVVATVSRKATCHASLLPADGSDPLVRAARASARN